MKVGFDFENTRPPEVAEKAEMLDAYLDEIVDKARAFGRPIIGLHIKVAGTPPSAAGIDFTVNGDHGALVFSEVKVEGQPRVSWESKGDKEFAKVVHWWGEGKWWAEVAADAEVPFELVRKAVHEFAETGERPSCVEWRPPTEGLEGA